MAGKTDTPKKHRSQSLRVAVRCTTTDGRALERQWLFDSPPTIQDYRRDQRWAIRELIGNSRTIVELR